MKYSYLQQPGFDSTGCNLAGMAVSEPSSQLPSALPAGNTFYRQDIQHRNFNSYCCTFSLVIRKFISAMHILID